MADTNWIVVAASMLGGGACGSIITLVVNSVRGRKQPVGYKLETIPVFKGKMLGGSNITGSLFINSIEGGYGQALPNLSVIKLEILNRVIRTLTPLGLE